MKRNIINEIRAIKSRNESNSRITLLHPLDDLEHQFKILSKEKLSSTNEFYKYIPIATVACLESFFRECYCEIINFGDPFSKNVSKFNQVNYGKFNFEIVNAIQKKSVTVGDFVSHLLPCNNFEDINSNMSILIDKDFIQELKTFPVSQMSPSSLHSQKNLIKNCSQIISDLNRIFELRHIFCHEFATEIFINSDELLNQFKNCKSFLLLSDAFMWHILYPNSPNTTAEMVIQSSNKFAEIEDELSSLISQIKNTKNDVDDYSLELNLFDKNIKIWKEYRTSKAELDASVVFGGSLYPIEYAMSLTRTTQEKIESLKIDYNHILRKGSKLGISG